MRMSSMAPYARDSHVASATQPVTVCWMRGRLLESAPCRRRRNSRALLLCALPAHARASPPRRLACTHAMAADAVSQRVNDALSRVFAVTLVAPPPPGALLLSKLREARALLMRTRCARR